MQWNSGIDADRSYYPAKWDFYFKYWPFGGTEPAYFSVARTDMPCHDDGSGPDASGNCSTYVAGPQPAGNWKYFIRGHLNIAQSLPGYMPNPTDLYIDSSPSAFTSP